MTDVTQQVREMFTAQGREVEVPPFDEVRFRGEVRRARSRRAGRLAVGAALAAGVAAVALVAVPPMLEGGPSADRPDGSTGVADAAAPELYPGELRAPLYYNAGARLVAATPDGEVHDLGPSESVIGFTAEGVLSIDAENRLVWTAALSSGEGDGSFTFEPGAGPVALPTTGPVQSAALSLDGRYLAWSETGDGFSVWDLKADRRVKEAELVPGSSVSAVSEQGVLVFEEGQLELWKREVIADMPTDRVDDGAISDTAGDLVTVVGRDDVTRVYDVTTAVWNDSGHGPAKLVDEVPGVGRLAPYARGIVSVDGATVRLWPASGEPVVLTGIGGAPQSVGWLDEDYAVVTAAEGDGIVVYLCPVADAACTPVAFSEADVRLAE